VEILSALQDRLPGCPTFQPDQLATIRTLRDIVEVLAARPAAPVIQATTAPNPEPEPAPDTCRMPMCYAPVSVPLESGRSRTPIQLPESSEIWIIGDDAPLTAALRSRLEFLGQPVRIDRWDSLQTAAVPRRLGALVLLSPPRGLDERLTLDAFGLMKSAGGSLRRAAGPSSTPVFLTVSNLDGHFGLSGEGLGSNADPRSGALSGLSKTARLEWPEVRSKALDVDPAGNSPEDVAAFIVDELLHDGPVEVGLCREGAVQIKLVPEEDGSGADRPGAARELDAGDVVVISGGARGVTAEVAVALATAFRPTIILLGRTPAPTAEPTWLAAATGELDVKKAILGRNDAPRAPQAVNERARQVLAQREIARNLARITAAGGRAFYHAVDVTDAAKVDALMRSVRARHGLVRGLIHGAGVLADRKIEDLGPEQFARVFETKVRGLNHLFQSLDPRSLKLLALFSSSTARFGRIGQAAYAAANEALNKWAQRQAAALPDCFVASFNWGPWDGGMVTAPLKQMFESEGLGLIPLEAGARLLVDRFREGRKRAVEVVVLAGELPRELGLLSPSSPQVPVAHKPAVSAAADPHANGRHFQTVLERTIDLESAPVLHSHVIDGHAVVPTALILEWLCEAALQRNPGLLVRGLDDLRILKGIVLRGGQGASVRLRAGKSTRRDGEYVVPVELIGTLSGNGRHVTHARANVVLADRLGAGSPDPAELDLAPSRWSAESIYRDILFHGVDFQGISRIEGQGARSIAGRVAVSPDPSSWFEAPLRRSWLTDPLAVDSALQLVVLWGRDVLGLNSLPTAIGSYRQHRRSFPADGVRVVARIRQASEHRLVAEIEFLDDEGELVARIDSYEGVLDSSLNQAFRRNRLATAEVARVS
jgi:NAD(P)-dependent dehydrogenase (short-subunit alcohol dehydrogenase family)